MINGSAIGSCYCGKRENNEYSLRVAVFRLNGMERRAERISLEELSSATFINVPQRNFTLFRNIIININMITQTSPVCKINLNDSHSCKSPQLSPRKDLSFFLNSSLIFTRIFIYCLTI